MRVVHVIAFRTIVKFVTAAAVLTVMQVVGTAQGQESLLFHRPEYVVDQAGFEALTRNVHNNPTVFFPPQSSFGNVVFRGVIQAGSATGTPPDSPADREDPNVPAGSPFGGVGSLEIVHPTMGTFICSGSVLTDNHVLSAAHCFDLDDNGVVDAGLTTTFNVNDGGSPSSTHPVAAITIHPDFTGFTDGLFDDLAVLELSTSVPAVTPKYAIRNTGQTSAEVLELVGYGQSGFGDKGFNDPTGVDPTFFVKRSGENEADMFFLDDEGSGEIEVFLHDFDGPVGTGFLGGGTRGNDIETTIGGGDSGSPAFVDVSADHVIVGVNTFELVLFAAPGVFGSLAGGIDIAPYTDWIVATAPGVQVVPEPTSVALLLSTVLACGCLRRGRYSKRVA